MARDIIRTPDAPPPPPTYSQAVRAAGLVFVSGTGPHDPATGKIVGDTIQEQTRQCLENISAILQAAGTSLDRIVSATVILLEEGDFAGMNGERIRWFPANPRAPRRKAARPNPRHESVDCSYCRGLNLNHSPSPQKIDLLTSPLLCNNSSPAVGNSNPTNQFARVEVNRSLLVAQLENLPGRLHGKSSRTEPLFRRSEGSRV